MARFKNFSMWRQRLPHWRADEVTYYVTFRHRRELSETERNSLFRRLLKLRDLEMFALAVFPDKTELLTRLNGAPKKDLLDIVDKARKKVTAEANKKSASPFPLFYNESYDHIVRDEVEYEEFCNNLLEEADNHGDDFETIWFAEDTPEFKAE